MQYDIYVTYEMMHDDIMYFLLPKIPRDICGILGIPRSGMIPCAMLATAMHVPMGIIGGVGFFGGNRVEKQANIDGGKILVIDDSVNSGKTFRMHEEQIQLLKRNFDVIRSCVYMKEGMERVAPLFAKYLKVPRLFEWNLFNSYKICDMVFDMDGVFCQDPVAFDDDGEAYEKNIANAIPLYIPTYPIKAICTSRLEKWRKITENWLNQYGIKYEQLIMCQCSTAFERRKKADKALLKAQAYVELKASLFVESSKYQAKRIAELSKKNVLSIEDKRIYCP